MSGGLGVPASALEEVSEFPSSGKADREVATSSMPMSSDVRMISHTQLVMVREAGLG